MTQRFLAAALMGVILAAPASASLFLNDWGVGYDAWDPSAFTGQVDYIVDDWKHGDTPDGYLGPGWGGQGFDVEAMYFGADTDYYYMAVVTGFRPSGRQGFGAGDLFLDLGTDGTWDHAFDVSDGDAGRMMSGITGVENPDAGGGENWGGVSDPYRVTGALETRGLSPVEWSYDDFDGRYAIEVKVDRSYLGAFDQYHLHWTMGCGNDVLDLRGEVEPVPEPATLLLVGGGLAGLASRRLRRRKPDHGPHTVDA
jgi:hypothetical protein